MRERASGTGSCHTRRISRFGLGLATFMTLVLPLPARAADLPALRPLALQEGETRFALGGKLDARAIREAAPDGVLHVLQSWRENGNAWGYHDLTVTVRDTEGRFSLVGSDPLPENAKDGLRDHLQDAPHTGEDTILSLAFATSADPAHPGFYLVECQRTIDGPVPDPAPARLIYFKLVASDGTSGWTPLYFQFQRVVQLEGRFDSADEALKKAFPLGR
ncbi:hypothetical protein [Asaia krungthepensis]|uniref:hypothetical protein n=2 Tax=Asaia krungthepensis TaxID=220990 RepID=UPI0036709B1C